MVRSLLNNVDPLRTLTHAGTRDEVAVATYAVQLASSVARELQKALATRTAMAKSDSSPVTVADFTVQVQHTVCVCV